MNSYKSILITGGAGFIGTHLVRRMVKQYPGSYIFNLDALSYAADLSVIDDLKKFRNYKFIKADITQLEQLKALFVSHDFEVVIHLAAESHVDNSINNPFAFVQTNIQGTFNLLEVARQHWGNHSTQNRFYHISTDEVYGSLGSQGFFTEQTSYDPRSPYSASKASSDHLVRAYFHTYGLPILISNCSNNYGPHQHSEKLIPLFIKNIINIKPLPIYGEGENIRDWLYLRIMSKLLI